MRRRILTEKKIQRESLISKSSKFAKPSPLNNQENEQNVINNINDAKENNDDNNINKENNIDNNNNFNKNNENYHKYNLNLYHSISLPSEKTTSIFRVKSKYLHNIIDKYIPKMRLLRIAFRNKRLQNLSNIKLEDYEVYHILKKNIYTKFEFSKRGKESSDRTLKNIFELTKSELLFSEHLEIDVPSNILTLIQMKNFDIAAATQNSVFIIEYIQSKKKFSIKKEIKLDISCAVVKMVEINGGLLLASTINQSFIINIEQGQITFDIQGCCPISLNDGRIAYVYEESFLRITNLNQLGSEEEIKLEIDIIKPGEDTKKFNKVCAGIQLASGNILLANYDETISEYNIGNKACVQRTQTGISFIETITELKDGRIAITAMDNGIIYLINMLKASYLLKLCGHSDTVIKLLQLENEQLISGSFDGKIKIWYKLSDGNFNCAMTLYLFNDYVRDMIFMYDGRILITGDDKTLRALGVKNYVNNFSIEFLPEDKKKETIKSFQLIDNRIDL